MKKIINYIKSKIEIKKPTEEIDIDNLAIEDKSKSSTDKSDNTYNMYDFFKFWIAGGLVFYVGYLAYGVIDTVYLIIFGFILSVAMEANIAWFIQKKFSRGFAIGITYLILIGFLIMGVLIIIPFMVTQISDILKIFIQYFTTIQGYISQMGVVGYINSIDIPYFFKDQINQFVSDPQYLANLQNSLLGSIDTIVKQSSSYVGSAGNLVVNIASGFAGFFFKIGLVFTSAIMFSIDHDSILSYTNKSTNNPIRSYKIKKIYTKIGFWLKSQLLLCIYIFIASYIGLFILELFGISVPNKFSLALMSGLTEFIPYIGPILGSIPAILVGTISEGWIGLLGVGILYFIIQRLENNILIPMVMNKTLGVSTSLIFLCVLFFGMILGVVGVILAIPIAIIISVMSE